MKTNNGSTALREHNRLAKRLHTTDFSKATWCKSGDSAVFSPICVEVAHKNGIVAVRDNKDLSIAPLRFTSTEWKAFVSGVKKGQFDY